MRLFITGCTGFLGRVCLEKLAASPEIERLYLLIHKTPQEFYHPKITAIPGDVLDLGNIRLDEAVDACLLLAGAINGRASSKETYSVNFSGTESAITFCRNNNIPRIILTSSVNVRLPHLGAYGCSKLDAENLVKDSGLEWLIFRPSLIYGRRCRFGLYIIERTIRRFGVVPVFGNGRKLEQPIHVDECAEFVSWFTMKGTNGRTIELFGRDAMTYNDLCRKIAECMNKRVKLLHVPAWPAVMGLRMFEALNIAIPLSSEQIYHVDTDLAGDMTAIHAETGILQKSFAENYSQDGLCDEVP